MLALDVGPAAASPPVQVAKLTASDGVPFDQFGAAVAVSDDTIVVGARRTDVVGSDSGAAYVYKPDGGGGHTETKLVSSDGPINDQFGASVAVDGDTIVVGARRADGGGADSGAAYVYTPDGGGGYDEVRARRTGRRTATPTTSSASRSACPATRSSSAPARTTRTARTPGATYVFTSDGGGGWNAPTKLIASDGAAIDWFGVAVGVTGDTVVVGARTRPYPSDDSGAAYVYTPDGGGGYDEEPLTPSDGHRRPVRLLGRQLRRHRRHRRSGVEPGTTAPVYVYTPDGGGGHDEVGSRRGTRPQHYFGQDRVRVRRHGRGRLRRRIRAP